MLDRICVISPKADVCWVPMPKNMQNHQCREICFQGSIAKVREKIALKAPPISVEIHKI